MTRGFTFRLEAPLRQRIQHEQAIQVALANVMAAYQDAVHRADDIAREHARAERDAAATGAVSDWNVRTNLLYYLERLRRALQQQRRVVAQREDEVGRVRALLVEAARRRRALERLRERQLDEYKRELVRRQDLELDEAATLRYARTAAAQGGFDAR